MTFKTESFVDRLIGVFDTGLKTIVRSEPLVVTSHNTDSELSREEKKKSASMMRINHAGEICAQGLYEGQALVSRSENTRLELLHAAQEERKHLQWCEERLRQLEEPSSVFVPVLYGMSVCIGAAAGMVGDKVSLGFVEATEDQVCKHLDEHLNEMSPKDSRSREILKQIREDEKRHGKDALERGGLEFPRPVKEGMTLVSKLMTETTRHW